MSTLATGLELNPTLSAALMRAASSGLLVGEVEASPAAKAISMIMAKKALAKYEAAAEAAAQEAKNAASKKAISFLDEEITKKKQYLARLAASEERKALRAAEMTVQANDLQFLARLGQGENQAPKVLENRLFESRKGPSALFNAVPKGYGQDPLLFSWAFGTGLIPAVYRHPVYGLSILTYLTGTKKRKAFSPREVKPFYSRKLVSFRPLSSYLPKRDKALDYDDNKAKERRLQDSSDFVIKTLGKGREAALMQEMKEHTLQNYLERKDSRPKTKEPALPKGTPPDSAPVFRSIAEMRIPRNQIPRIEEPLLLDAGDRFPRISDSPSAYDAAKPLLWARAQLYY